MRLQHFGVIGKQTDVDMLIIPPSTGFRSYRDSFLVWGEHRKSESNDNTLHVIHADEGTIEENRVKLESMLFGDLRLFDYATTSDSDDWSEDETVHFIDGTVK